MHKNHRIIKCFLPLLTVLYAVIFTLLIGVITDREAVRWYHYALETVAYLLFILQTALFLRKCYPKIFPESAKYSFCLPSSKDIFALLLLMPLYMAALQRLFLFFYSFTGQVVKRGTDYETIPEILVLSIVSVFFAPVIEEFVFRFMALSPYQSKMGKATALVIISLLFALLHWHSPYTTVISGIDGLLWGIVFLLTKNIWYGITMHIINNLMVSFAGILLNLQAPKIWIEDNIFLIYFGNEWLLFFGVLALVGILLIKASHNK